MNFPNLPYWIEGDLKLVQSAAILRHVARKAKLIGDTLEEQAVVDMLEQQAIDFRVGLTKRCYSDDFENLRGPYLAELDGLIKDWSNYLGRCPSCRTLNRIKLDFEMNFKLQFNLN